MGRVCDAALARNAMGRALRGNKASDGRVRSIGVCEQLGLKRFTPHDLRRSAASLIGSIGISAPPSRSASITPPRISKARAAVDRSGAVLR
jgi:integrase